jgi:superfamily II DNA helicase RecQ
MDMMTEMQNYLESTSCRRKFILKHFEGKKFELPADHNPDNCCDVCRQKYVAQFLFIIREQGFSTFVTADAFVTICRSLTEHLTKSSQGKKKKKKV